MNTKLYSQILAAALTLSSAVSALQPAQASGCFEPNKSTIAASSTVNVETLWKIVNSLLKAGKMQAAMNAVEDALKADSKNSELYLMKAYVMYNANAQSESVIAQLNIALSLSSNNLNALFLRGVVYEDMKDLDHAVKDFDTCIAMDNHYVSAIKESINIKFKMKNWVGAMNVLNLYIANNKVDGTAYFERAFAEYKLGQISQAISDLKQAKAMFIAANDMENANTASKMIEDLQRA